MNQDPQPAWIGLLVAGIINVLYCVVFFGWTGVSFAWTGVVALANIPMILETGDPTMIIVSLINILSPIIQLIWFFIGGLLALITIASAFKLKSYSSRGMVMAGAVFAAAVPLLSLVANSLSLCSCSCGGQIVGFIFSNVPTLIIAIIGTGLGIWTIVTIRNPDVTAAFAANS
jgi:hypothetical protein